MKCAVRAVDCWPGMSPVPGGVAENDDRSCECRLLSAAALKPFNAALKQRPVLNRMAIDHFDGKGLDIFRIIE
jgi:hypothetical protein